MREVQYRHIDEIVNGYNKIIAWGAGGYFDYYHKILTDRLSYIVDKDSTKTGTEKYGLITYLPEKLKEENPETCLIVIFCKAYEEVASDIEKYGNFDALDIVNYQLLHGLRLESRELTFEADRADLVLICVGAEMLWEVNGANKFIMHQNSVLYKEGFHTVEIAPVSYYTKKSEKKCYLAVRYDEAFCGIVSLEEFLQRNKEFQGVIIHSLYREPWVLEGLLSQISVRSNILYYLHDFYVICKNRFLYHKGKTCLDKMQNFHCRHCENKRIQEKNAAFHKRLFETFSIILIAPSQSTKRIAEKFFKGIQIDIVPHLDYKFEEYAKGVKKVANIAYIGSASDIKGWEEFCELKRILKGRYRFFCLGKCDKNLRTEGITYIDIGKDSIPMVDGLKENSIDIAYIGSIWPETYSYTYHEAFEAGCFVIAFDTSGNVADQIEKNKNGKVFLTVQKMAEWLGNKEEVGRIVNKANICIKNVKGDKSFVNYFQKG